MLSLRSQYSGHDSNGVVLLVNETSLAKPSSDQSEVAALVKSLQVCRLYTIFLRQQHVFLHKNYSCMPEIVTILMFSVSSITSFATSGVLEIRKVRTALYFEGGLALLYFRHLWRLLEPSMLHISVRAFVC